VSLSALERCAFQALAEGQNIEPRGDPKVYQIDELLKKLQSLPGIHDFRNVDPNSISPRLGLLEVLLLRRMGILHKIRGARLRKSFSHQEEGQDHRSSLHKGLQLSSIHGQAKFTKDMRCSLCVPCIYRVKCQCGSTRGCLRQNNQCIHSMCIGRLLLSSKFSVPALVRSIKTVLCNNCLGCAQIQVKRRGRIGVCAKHTPFVTNNIVPFINDHSDDLNLRLELSTDVVVRDLEGGTSLMEISITEGK